MLQTTKLDAPKSIKVFMLEFEGVSECDDGHLIIELSDKAGDPLCVCLNQKNARELLVVLFHALKHVVKRRLRPLVRGRGAAVH